MRGAKTEAKLRMGVALAHPRRSPFSAVVHPHGLVGCIQRMWVYFLFKDESREPAAAAAAGMQRTAAAAAAGRERTAAVSAVVPP